MLAMCEKPLFSTRDESYVQIGARLKRNSTEHGKAYITAPSSIGRSLK
jgi:hypothetical protein